MYKCEGQEPIKVAIPEIGSLRVDLRRQCSISLESGETVSYATENFVNETTFEVVLPNTWEIERKDKNCMNWKACFEKGILNDEVEPVTSGVGRIPVARIKGRSKISFTFGEVKKRDDSNDQIQKLEMVQIRDQCLWVMAGQLVILFLSGTIYRGLCEISYVQCTSNHNNDGSLRCRIGRHSGGT